MKFTDLKFEPHPLGGFGSHTEINGHVLSVQCSQRNYCDPREDLDSPEDYASFEIAIWEATGDKEWCTQRFTDIDDEVIGWISREEIEEIIEKILDYSAV
jgi:hypothetical protein